MSVLFKNGYVVNVFTEETVKANVLVSDGRIVGVGDYREADETVDVSGKYICPGFIDGHIHIESTMMIPPMLARAVLPHGTTSIVADPHEIANVCGKDGIKYILEKSRKLPLSIYCMLPSCVPASEFDESGAVLTAADLREFYEEESVLGLAEMMNYPGVIYGDEEVYNKINDAFMYNRRVDGHAPLLTGNDLDKYVSAGVTSDHECTSFEEAKEKLGKGQWIMIRQGTAAKNLDALIGLLEEPYASRCLFATDDCHPADILNAGHIDNIIRLAIKKGVKPERAVRVATINAAVCFGLKGVGAIAPGYRADMVILDSIDAFTVAEVYSGGKLAASSCGVVDFAVPEADRELEARVRDTINLGKCDANSFMIEPKGDKCRVISVIPGSIITDEVKVQIDWNKHNGIDVSGDILKLAVVERHNKTEHIGLGFISGIGIRKGAIASSVSHDSHNIIVIGTNEEDMATAVNHIISMGGGNVVVEGGTILADMALPIAGLMSDKTAKEIATENAKVRSKAHELGAPQNVEPFMNMAFVSLPVIPHLKMSTTGLVDVDAWKRVPLYL